jgi:hypothetical protein
MIRRGPTKSPFNTFFGHLNFDYIGNFNHPQSRSNTGASNARAFGISSGQFQLGLVQTKMVYANDVRASNLSRTNLIKLAPNFQECL